MKHLHTLLTLALMTQAVMAQNRVNLHLSNGTTEHYETANVRSIDFDGNRVTVNATDGNAVTHDGTVTTINFRKANAIVKAQGWQESAYAEWTRSAGTTYNVYCQPYGTDTWTRVDPELVRLYPDYGRADVVGLRPGSYRLRVVPVTAGTEQPDAAMETDVLTVTAYDRQGFAHKNHEGVGAYQDDGTRKPGAKVVYVTAATAKTVTAQLPSGSFTGVQAIINAYQKGNVTEPLAVRFIGMVSADDLDYMGSSAEGIQVKGRTADSELNITIEGIGEDACVKGFGFLVRNAKSVEFRNLGILRALDDGISLDTDNSNIWVHNIDVFYGKAGSGDKAKGDGAIDVKSDSKFVTVAYCHFWDTGKSSMCGMTSESGANYVSYHHNWFDHSDSRHARVRTMSVHLWNNYFDGVSKYGIGATTGSSVFAENNYFRHTHNPMLISLQGTDAKGTGTFSGETGGMIKAFGNLFAETGTSSYYRPITAAQHATSFDCYETATRDEQVPATVVTLQGATPYNNFDTDASLMYAYTPDEAQAVPAKVTGYYGAGRLNHGDLQFAFNNATDDTDYGVNAALAALIDAYTGTGGTQGGSETNTEPTPADSTETNPTPTDSAAIGETVVCTFDKTGMPSSDRFAVVGNGSNSKGTATYNGIAYSNCLKMESTTSITFTTTETMRLTLVFGDTETISFKLDGVKTVGTGSTYTIDALLAGQHVITKQNVGNLFVLVLEKP